MCFLNHVSAKVLCRFPLRPARSLRCVQRNPVACTGVRWEQNSQAAQKGRPYRFRACWFLCQSTGYQPHELASCSCEAACPSEGGSKLSHACPSEGGRKLSRACPSEGGSKLSRACPSEGGSKLSHAARVVKSSDQSQTWLCKKKRLSVTHERLTTGARWLTPPGHETDVPCQQNVISEEGGVEVMCFLNHVSAKVLCRFPLRPARSLRCVQRNPVACTGVRWEQNSQAAQKGRPYRFRACWFLCQST